MSSFILIAFCLVSGALLRLTRRLPQGTPAVLNGLIFHVSLPAATLASIPSLRPRAELLLPAAMAALASGPSDIVCQVIDYR